MSGERWAAILAALASVSVLVAGYYQWWSITWDGKLVTRTWIKILFGILIAVQIVIVYLVVTTP